MASPGELDNSENKYLAGGSVVVERNGMLDLRVLRFQQPTISFNNNSPSYKMYTGRDVKVSWRRHCVSPP